MGLWDKLKNVFKKSKENKDTDNLKEQIQKKNEENRIWNHEKEADFDAKLNKTSSGFSKIIDELQLAYSKNQFSENFYDELIDSLVGLDIGYTASEKIANAVRDEVKRQDINDFETVLQILLDKLIVYYIQDTNISTDINISKQRKTNVIVVVGANGVGKTTTIAKLTNFYKEQGYKILLVAGDTFRAGAVEQLKVHANKIGVDIITPDKVGEDPAAVTYKGIKKGYEENYSLIICDTSGRLQNKVNLMNELSKIIKQIKKFDETAPHEILLVLDATVGQSGLAQAKAFNEAANVSGIVLVKMDSSSKGGIVLAIKDQFNIPVKLIGYGETLQDIAEFNLEEYIKNLIKNIKIDNTSNTQNK